MTSWTINDLLASVDLILNARTFLHVLIGDILFRHIASTNQLAKKLVSLLAVSLTKPVTGYGISYLHEVHVANILP